MTSKVPLSTKDTLDALARRAGLPLGQLLDLLVRGLGEERALEVLVGRRTRDGAARAAWSRARPR